MVRSRSVAVVAAGLVLAVGGCGGGSDEKAGASDSGSAKPTPARPPSKELVKWVGDMCESTIAAKRLRADSTDDLKEIRDSDDELFPEARTLSYLSRTLTVVEQEKGDLEDLGPSGVPAADRMLGTWRKKVKGVAAELRAMYTEVDADDAKDTAKEADKLVQSLTPPKPDLRALTKKEPRLAAAYERAEQCAPGWKPSAGETAPSSPDPTGPLPKAKDGKNYGACSDGKCEVLVTSTADITANGVNLHVTVGNSVTFLTPNSTMVLGGQGGVGEFGDTLKVTVIARNEDGAVLKFSIP